MSDIPETLSNETTQRLIDQEKAPLDSVKRGVGPRSWWQMLLELRFDCSNLPIEHQPC